MVLFFGNILSFFFTTIIHEIPKIDLGEFDTSIIFLLFKQLAFEKVLILGMDHNHYTCGSNTGNTAPFHELPDDLCNTIRGYLTIHDVLTLCMASRRMYTLFSSNTLWRDIYEKEIPWLSKSVSKSQDEDEDDSLQFPTLSRESAKDFHPFCCWKDLTISTYTSNKQRDERDTVYFIMASNRIWDWICWVPMRCNFLTCIHDNDCPLIGVFTEERVAKGITRVTFVNQALSGQFIVPKENTEKCLKIVKDVMEKSLTLATVPLKDNSESATGTLSRWFIISREDTKRVLKFIKPKEDQCDSMGRMPHLHAYGVQCEYQCDSVGYVLFNG